MTIYLSLTLLAQGMLAMKKFFLLFVGIFVFGFPELWAVSITLEAAEDSFVSEGLADNNFGTQNILRVAGVGDASIGHPEGTKFQTRK